MTKQRSTKSNRLRLACQLECESWSGFCSLLRALSVVTDTKNVRLIRPPADMTTMEYWPADKKLVEAMERVDSISPPDNCRKVWKAPWGRFASWEAGEAKLEAWSLWWFSSLRFSAFRSRIWPSSAICFSESARFLRDFPPTGTSLAPFSSRKTSICIDAFIFGNGCITASNHSTDGFPTPEIRNRRWNVFPNNALILDEVGW